MAAPLAQEATVSSECWAVLVSPSSTSAQLQHAAVDAAAQLLGAIAEADEETKEGGEETTEAGEQTQEAGAETKEAGEATKTAAGEGTQAEAQPAADLRCEWCHAIFFQPVTLGDGRTLCKMCVSKVPRNEHMHGKDLGFGNHENKVLSEIACHCAPQAHEAARVRHESNAAFRSKDFAAAVEGYTKAIGLFPHDAVLWGNRAAANIALQKFAEAAADSKQACALLLHNGLGKALRSPLLLKWLVRRAISLEKLKQFQAAATWALVQALNKYQGCRPMKSATQSVLICLEQLNDIQKFGPSFLQTLNVKQQVPNSAYWTFQAPRASFSSLVLGQDEKQAHELPTPTNSGLVLAESKLAEIRESLKCPLCFELLFEPTTLPCGHVLCRPCLARTLDHAFDSLPACPMCRHSLAPLLGWLNMRARLASVITSDRWSHGGRQIAVTSQLQALLQVYFPKESDANRVRYTTEENAGDQASIPIFCCSVALPGIKTSLHVFEPRYRLMMRRCIESGQKKFGMCLSPTCEYGTMLRILEYEQLPDGRSRIECIGENRFKVNEWGEKDGYKIGKVEWVDDVEEAVTGVEASGAVQEIRNALSRVLPPSALSQLEDVLGPMPKSPGDKELIYWGASVLSAIGLLPHDKLYRLAFGDAVELTRASPAGRPTFVWEPATDGRASLRQSHSQRAKVLKVYVDVIAAAASSEVGGDSEK